MIRIFCKSKIHGAVVTNKNISYTGSIAIDKKLLKLADILPNEIVLVANVNTGQRFETYVIEQPFDSGRIGLQGAAARLGEIGDKLIIISYAFFEDKKIKSYKPKIVIVNEKNYPVKQQ